MTELEQFYQQERSRLVHFIRKRLRDTSEHSAEDIVQDVMLHVYERWDVSQPIGDLAAYIYRSIRNRIIDIYRQPRRQAPIEDEGLERILSDLQVDTFSEVERRALREAIFDAVATLGRSQQEVWLATEIDGIAFKDLAALWDVPIGTLLARKKRANDRLRAILSQYITEEE